MQIEGQAKVTSEAWLSVEEIATHLGISKETVYRWLEKRKLPGHRVGRLWKFQKSEVDVWVRAGGAAEESNKFRDNGLLGSLNAN